MGGEILKAYICRYRMILFLGVFICFSCCTGYVFETERKSPGSVASRSFSFPSSLTDFFSYSCTGIDSIISTLRNINKEKDFIAGFLKEYGIPLWNYTCIMKGENEVSYYVPLYQGKSMRSIDAFWFFHISDGKIIYAPFRRTDERIKNNEQRFVFDWLTWEVFGENNAYGLFFKEKESSSRAWILIENCWDVYTGTANNLEYQYTNCVQKSFWIDETIYWLTTAPDDDSSGGSTSVGGGGNSGTSGGVSTSASNIFCNDDFTDDSWNMADYLLEDILEDCMGEALYNGIKEKLNGDKITLRFTEAGWSGYSWNSKTLNISVDQLESNVLFHEMFHLYQTLSESEQSFENSLMNREIEAHYAQYLFRKNESPLWNVETGNIYEWNQRLRTCLLINRYIDDYGVLKDLNLKYRFEALLIGNVIDAFRGDGYDNYPFNFDSLEQTFNIVNELTENCKP